MAAGHAVAAVSSATKHVPDALGVVSATLNVIMTSALFGRKIILQEVFVMAERGAPEQPFPRIPRARFLNTTLKDIQIYMGDHDDKEPEEDSSLENWDLVGAGDLESEPMPAGDPPNGMALIQPRRSSAYDHILLSYYEAVICSSSTLLDDEKNNPYRHVLLPMALQSQGVYHATLAISASTLRLARPEYGVVALEHRHLALKSLINILNHSECDAQDMDEMLGLILMLCWFEISDGCNPSWVKHLDGFRRLIHRRQRLAGGNSLRRNDLESFFIQYFAFHLVLAKTAFRVEESGLDSAHVSPKLSTKTLASAETGEVSMALNSFTSSTSFLSLHMDLDSLHDIDPYMGFSNSLLLLINEVADLASTSSSPDSQDNFATATVLRLKASLDELQQCLPESAMLNMSLVTRRPAFTSTAETYRLGALLLLHEVLMNSYSGSLAYNQVFQPADKHQYTHSIIQLIDENLECMISTAVLPLWPLFLAGCCVDNEEERMTALRLFELIEHRKRFGNIKPARKVMEMVWTQRDLSKDVRQRSDLNNNSGPQFRKYREQYEWERASDMLGRWKISLT
ncbi:uncharacterized protein Z518_07743 [Rhinocladiella mackenziei CBS 650.93]|uniref:Uncharacterized protein n=1 Tax=Rhinocladiella mackenziei CBS 650.93 TaxID=1442369 RepID=A0A0D2IED3_9EURO|nr:uncharacterized protein Z518_07743 [Rhinocladiella mackenziei CBS 650.93]KIX04189.1 hypothetical protein Z518_07743 [Rhinocladiella mackenziei CBS 650.93]